MTVATKNLELNAMQKIRIYELAKELGVDNKVVVNRAIELGMRGKISHSNSLEADEADQIRRALLRQAVSPTHAHNSETVTTKVDKVSGVANTIVEKRKGNVIRRRKAEDGAATPVAAAVATGTAAADALFEEAPAPAEHVELAQPVVVEAVSEEISKIETPVTEVAESSNGHVVEAPAIEAAPPAALEPELINNAAVEVQSAEVEAEPVAKVTPPSGVRTVVIMRGQGGAISNESAARGQSIGVAPTIKPGARVLGRIELPVKKVLKAEVKRPTTAAAPAARKPATPFYDPEEEEGAKNAKKRSKKVEISRIDLVDYEGGEGRRVRVGGKKKKQDDSQAQLDTSMKASKRVVQMHDAITVGDLAKQLSLKAGEVISKLFGLGVIATINQALDKDTATIVADEFGFVIESTSFNEETFTKSAVQDDPGTLQARPPVVTIMGHVDHGKTTLLDAIRSASVAAGEAGGITQHIGAYQVAMEDGRKVTFLDTPGHAAFTAMRARGAQVTDIVVLVVAADDGVMPQTLEAINHAKAAKVTIAVALNKVDKPDATPDRVRQKLAEHGLQPEDWGGDTMFFPVSALKKTGIKEMLEGLLLLADVKELKANPDRPAQGTVIESRQDKGRGTVVTVLVQNGTLKVGDVFVSGAEFGRIRAMYNDLGQKIDIALPSTPVEITGVQGVPDSGDDFFVVDNEAQAREVALNRLEKKRVKAQRAIATGPISLEEFARRANDMTMTELNVILKADVHGSVEAVKAALEGLSTSKVKVRVLHAAVGGVHESDVQLATASKAMIVGFGVRGEPQVLSMAENAGVQVRFYRIIYELIDDVKVSMTGLLAPVKQESSLGRAEVRNTFPAPKVGIVAGCYIVNGMARRGAALRLLRDNRVIHEGKVSSLRRFKEDVKEVQSGYECGISIEGYNDIKVGDIIEIYEIKEVAATLEG